MRRSVTIALCLLAASAVTWLRYAALGRLSVFDDLSIWPRALFGVCVGVAGWLYVRAPRAPEDTWRRLLVGAGLVQLAALAALPLTSNDEFANLAFGRLANSGHNPFLSTPVLLPAHDAIRALVDPRWLDAPFAYGPLVAALDAAVTRAGDLAATLIAYKLALAAVTFATTVAAWAFCRRELPPDVARAQFQRFALCPLLVWEATGQGHNDVLLVAALVGFVWAARTERAALAVVCLCLGVLCKFVAAPIAALYVVMIARRSVPRAALLALLAVAVAVAVTLPWWDGADTLGGLMKVVSPDAGRTTRSLADLLVVVTQPIGAGAQHVAYTIVWAAGLALMAGLGLVGLWRVRTPHDVIHFGLLLFLASDLVAAPWVHPWYTLWLLPLALAHRDARWSALVARYLALVALDYALPLDSFTSVAIDLYIGRQVIQLLRAPDEAAR